VMFLVKNIIVFHDLDKLTGSALHLFPLLQMWNIHWNIRGTQDRENWGFLNVDEISFDFQFIINYYISSMIFYFLWAAFYYATLYICWNHIREKEFYCLLMDELHRGQYVKQ